MVSEDRKEQIDKGLSDSQQLSQTVAKDTKSKEPERYYDLWELNGQYGNLWLSMVLGGRVPKQSLLVTGFTMMQSEAYDVHKFVVEGKYFAAFRELRYLLEFAKRAAALDLRRTLSIADKMIEYQARETRDDPTFRGGGLLKVIETYLKLSPSEARSIKSLFEKLSSYAHGSSEEVRPFTPGNKAVTRYDKGLFDLAYNFTASVTDVYLLFLFKLGMIDHTTVRIPSSLASRFSLSYPYLK